MKVFNSALTFEKTLIFLYGIFLLTMFILFQLDIKMASFMAFALFIMPFVLLVYYALNSKSIVYSLIIFLVSLQYIGGILKIYHYSFSSLILGLGIFPLIILTGMIVIGSVKHFKKDGEIKLASILLITIVLANVFLKVEILNFPIMLLLIYLYFQKEVNVINPSIKNGLKALMISYGTAIWLNFMLSTK